MADPNTATNLRTKIKKVKRRSRKEPPGKALGRRGLAPGQLRKAGRAVGSGMLPIPERSGSPGRPATRSWAGETMRPYPGSGLDKAKRPTPEPKAAVAKRIAQMRTDAAEQQRNGLIERGKSKATRPTPEQQRNGLIERGKSKATRPTPEPSRKAHAGVVAGSLRAGSGAPRTLPIPPGLAKRGSGEKSARSFAPGQRKPRR